MAAAPGQFRRGFYWSAGCCEVRQRCRPTQTARIQMERWILGFVSARDCLHSGRSHGAGL